MAFRLPLSTRYWIPGEYVYTLPYFLKSIILYHNAQGVATKNFHFLFFIVLRNWLLTFFFIKMILNVETIQNKMLPVVFLKFVHQIIQIKTFCVHDYRTIGFISPLLLWLIPVQFHAVIIRIIKINGFRHTMIACTG